MWAWYFGTFAVITVIVCICLAFGVIPARKYFMPGIPYHEPWIIRIMSWFTDGGK